MLSQLRNALPSASTMTIYKLYSCKRTDILEFQVLSHAARGTKADFQSLVTSHIIYPSDVLQSNRCGETMKFCLLTTVHLFAVWLYCCHGEESAKTGGTINDLFTDEESTFSSEEYAKLKDVIQLANDNIEKIFEQVEKRLDKQMEIIREKGSDVVPVTTFDKIRLNGGKIPEAVADKVRKRGVLIVRNTIPKQDVEQLVAEVLTYMYNNNVFPPKDNQVHTGH